MALKIDTVNIFVTLDGDLYLCIYLEAKTENSFHLKIFFERKVSDVYWSLLCIYIECSICGPGQVAKALD